HLAAGDERLDESEVLFPRHRAVDVVAFHRWGPGFLTFTYRSRGRHALLALRLAAALPRGAKAVFPVEGLGVDDRRDGVVKIQAIATQLAYRARRAAIDERTASEDAQPLGELIAEA